MNSIDLKELEFGNLLIRVYPQFSGAWIRNQASYFLAESVENSIRTIA